MTNNEHGLKNRKSKCDEYDCAFSSAPLGATQASPPQRGG
jgi:hypothetical protein